jgi:Kef-type K+ transport system membrane component KefB
LRRLLVTPLAEGGVSDGMLVGVTATAIASAVLTQAIGLHYLLGAFVAGLVVPVEIRKPLLERIEMPTAVLLMPFFFTSAGLRTTIDFSSAAFVQIFVVTTAATITGKIAGTAIPVRMLGEGWRRGLAVGALMQTKGLMELVVLTVLLDAGLINATVFSALVLMAVVSTGVAMPLTRCFMVAAEVPRVRPAIGPGASD